MRKFRKKKRNQPHLKSRGLWVPSVPLSPGLGESQNHLRGSSVFFQMTQSMGLLIESNGSHY